MAFQLYQHLCLATPALYGTGQGGQQQVVDLRAVGGGGTLQQLTGVGLAQLHCDAAGVAAKQAALGIGARQVADCALQLRLPVVQLGLDRGAAGVLAQALAPGFERTGLGHQLGYLPDFKLLVDLLQVFEQDAPGHTIDHQMVDHQ
ncbi:hypothetical protein D3C78_556290 [compost metagenome]